MKLYALKENHLFRTAYRRGGRRTSRTVSVYAMKDRSAGLLQKQNPMKQTVNRVGISASKKVGGAVQRNRAKRVIREAYRQIDKTAGVRKGFVIVIVPKTACTVCKMQNVREDLYNCLAALSLIPGADPAGFGRPESGKPDREQAAKREKEGEPT